jgi:hypothetical protein
VKRLDAAIRGGGTTGFPNSLAHLFRGAIGEGDTEGAARRNSISNHGGQTVGHKPSLAGACRGQHQQRAIKLPEHGLLFLVGITHRVESLVLGLHERQAGDIVELPGDLCRKGKEFDYPCFNSAVKLSVSPLARQVPG